MVAKIAAAMRLALHNDSRHAHSTSDYENRLERFKQAYEAIEEATASDDDG